MPGLIRVFNQDCSIFYNCQAVQQHSKTAYSHIEVESLPSGQWGYDHFAFESRYVRNLGLDIVGQTGKFHTAWGDFHSFKSKEALEYECYRMLMLNTKCMIGDQMEPKGRLSKPVYELIGHVYRDIREKEDWCRSVEAICDTAVFDPREFYEPCCFKHPEALLGAMKMLEQGGIQFDIIDSSMDFSKYRLLVLPDVIPVNRALDEKLDQYVQEGGSLILSYQSGFKLNGSTTGFSAMPVSMAENQISDYAGEFLHGRFDLKRNSQANYLLPKGAIGKGLAETEHVMYSKNIDVLPNPGSEILANAISPEFYRDYRHFCSHRQAPSSGNIEGPAIVRQGNIIYFAHNIFTMYQLMAPPWVKQIFINGINSLINPILKHDGPTTLLTTINRQKKEKRDVLHLLHYIPRRVCSSMDSIEDVIPLYNISLSLHIDKEIKSVKMVPSGESVDFSTDQKKVEFTINKLTGHQMIELKWT